MEKSESGKKLFFECVCMNRRKGRTGNGTQQSGQFVGRQITPTIMGMEVLVYWC